MISMQSPAGAASRRRFQSNGFTLVELVLVITVIAIVATIAIPNFLRSRMSAHEASAISSLRNIHSMNERYRLRFQTFASSLADLQNAGLIPEDLGSGAKAGYDFTYSGSAAVFTCTASPQTPGQSGSRYFYIDLSGVIRFSTTGVATASSAPIGQ